jgi:hypothetical protein
MFAVCPFAAPTGPRAVATATATAHTCFFCLIAPSRGAVNRSPPRIRDLILGERANVFSDLSLIDSYAPMLASRRRSHPARSRGSRSRTITPDYPTAVCAQALHRRAQNSAGRARKVGRRPLGTDHAKVINVPNPRAADLQRSVKQKSQRAVEGEAASIMARWLRRLPRRALEGGTRDPSSSRNHIRPPLRDTDRACGRPYARLSALSYLVRGTTCI